MSNRDNQTTQLDGSSDGIAHDRAGNALLLPPGPGGDWSTYLKLTWDGWNRLVSVKSAAGASVADYQYDGTFRRVRRTLADGETVDYFYNDQWKCLEERSSGGSSGAALASSSSSSFSSPFPSSSSSASSSFPSSSSSTGSSSSSSAGPASTSTQFVWGARPGHRDELILRERDTTGSGTYDQRHWCLMDYFNPTALVADDASVLERYRFSAFGVRTPMAPDWSARSASAYDFDFAFQGQFEDPETGYLDYGFRYYSPALGRWTSRDPITELGGDNVYTFVRNNGVGKNDRLGLFNPMDEARQSRIRSWLSRFNIEVHFTTLKAIQDMFGLQQAGALKHDKNRLIEYTEGEISEREVSDGCCVSYSPSPYFELADNYESYIPTTRIATVAWSVGPSEDLEAYTSAGLEAVWDHELRRAEVVVRAASILTTHNGNISGCEIKRATCMQGRIDIRKFQRKIKKWAEDEFKEYFRQEQAGIYDDRQQNISYHRRGAETFPVKGAFEYRYELQDPDLSTAEECPR